MTEVYAEGPDVVRIADAVSAEDLESVRGLMTEYAKALGVDLSFQNFSAELERLPGTYTRPAGILLLARVRAGVAGCVALQAWQSPAIAELKRLYVRPEYRGQQIGHRLISAALSFARAAGYREVWLDTLPEMRTAQAMYISLGFRPIGAYRENPVPGASYFALDLDARR